MSQQEISLERRLTSNKLRVLFKQAADGPVGDDVVDGICKLLITISEGGQPQADRALDNFNEMMVGRQGSQSQLMARTLLELFTDGSIDLVGICNATDELIWAPSASGLVEHQQTGDL